MPDYSGLGLIKTPLGTKHLNFAGLNDADYEPKAESTAFANMPISTSIDPIYVPGG